MLRLSSFIMFLMLASCVSTSPKELNGNLTSKAGEFIVNAEKVKISTDFEPRHMRSLRTLNESTEKTFAYREEMSAPEGQKALEQFMRNNEDYRTALETKIARKLRIGKKRVKNERIPKGMVASEFWYQNAIDEIEKFQCENNESALKTALKLEEFLPDEKARMFSIQLYSKLVNCDQDLPAERIYKLTYRLAMLKVWSGDCLGAIENLQKLSLDNLNLGFGSRAFYWLNYCHQKNGKLELATESRRELINKYPFSMHALLLGQRTYLTVLKYALAKDDVQVSVRSKKNLAANQVLAVAEKLIEKRENKQALLVLSLLKLEKYKIEPEVSMYVATLYNQMNEFIAKFQFLAPLLRENLQLLSRASLELLYPKKELPYVKEAPLEELLIYSQIRQESAFNVNARSPAGAVGLLQLMPSTAKRLQRVSRKQLLEPEINIKLGTKYMAGLRTKFNGSTELALAAYNAGALRVYDWLERYPSENKVLFIDLIPYQETREYVSSIARNYFWYYVLYKMPKEEADKLNEESITEITKGSPFDIFKM